MNTRDAYVEKLKIELDSINAGIDMCEARLRKANAATQERFHDEFTNLRKKRDDFADAIDEMKNSGTMALEEIKAGADVAATELRRSLERARERM